MQNPGQHDPNESRSIPKVAIDAMPQQVAVLDANGDIVLVNDAWVLFACENGLPGTTPETYLGTSYLAPVEQAARDSDELAQRALLGLRSVLRREREHFSLEYPCHSETEERYFLMTVTPTGEPLGGAVVVHADITQRKRLERRLEHLANHDDLTSLASRAYFYAHAEKLLATAARHDRPLHLLYIDLDGFKPINDTHGHATGDEVLTEIARRLKRNVRAGDLVARLGGDEFVALVEDGGSGEAVGQRYGEILGRPVRIPGGSVSVGASVGVSSFPADANDLDDLLQCADQMMYLAKASGRGVVTSRLFPPGDTEGSEAKAERRSPPRPQNEQP